MKHILAASSLLLQDGAEQTTASASFSRQGSERSGLTLALLLRLPLPFAGVRLPGRPLFLPLLQCCKEGRGVTGAEVGKGHPKRFQKSQFYPECPGSDPCSELQGLILAEITKSS